MLWVIQEGWEELPQLEAALKANNTPYCIGYPDSITAGETIIPRGSMQFVETLDSRFGEYSGMVSWTPPNYECSYYYTQLQIEKLLNGGCVFLPWKHLEVYGDKLFNLFGERLFIRPNEGYKTFTGTTVGKPYFYKELEIIKNLPHMIRKPQVYPLKPETLVLVSSAQKLLYNEYRFLMLGQKILSYSSYSSHPDQTDAGVPEKDLFSFVNSFHYRPDWCYTVDVCLQNGQLKVVEYNSGVCAGWYDMDYNKIVKEFNKYEHWKM